jgi:hypothetical protein
LDGQPVEGGAVIYFCPAGVIGTGIQPATEVAGGRFEASAVPGAYWVGVTGHDKNADRFPLIPERYANAAASGMTAEVTRDGPNIFDFKLTTP